MYNRQALKDIDTVFDHEELDQQTIPLMEDFYTIQGEGVHTGKPAYFIRTAGCDVNCWWCDVKDSWEESDHSSVKIGEIVGRAKESGAPIAVITGGEPLLHNLDPLTCRLKQEEIKVHIETSGSSPLSGYLDWITLSPKRFKKPVEEIFPYVDELKVVVVNEKDIKWAEENANKCPDQTRLLLQPEWGTPSSMDLIVDYIKEHPEWEISLQMHKFLGVR